MTRAAVILLGISLIGCARFRAPSLPDSRDLLRQRLVINSDVDLAARDELLQELVELQQSMSDQLGLHESAEPIYVNLFGDADEFEAYCRRRFPDLAGRRAYFVESAEGLVVLARWGNDVRTDLRHEVAHGYLHSVAPATPLWLDEGIAEFFEITPDRQGLNAEHVEALATAAREGRWAPDLLRLQRISDAAALSQQDYAEAWLWVHFLLTSDEARREQLRQYLAALQTQSANQTLAEAVGGEGPAVFMHLVKLERILASREPGDKP